MKVSLGAKPMAYPTPAWVIATYDKDNKPNVMTAAWGGICCSKPPCLTVSLRSATFSHAALVERKAFTVNIPTKNQIAQADYFGMASGRDYDKLAAAGMTTSPAGSVDAPLVNEIPLNIECKIVGIHELGLHTQFIGEIMDIQADDSILTEGKPDMAKLEPVVFCPEIRTYHALGEFLGRAFSVGKMYL
ncbi:flavin reductase family protein [Desulfovibrio inopinatus]|uniref:flavin reductase family protein n=1 Tax=Desulfovibrio inopinatus TaxID=102109 RepID=UPI00041DE87C|nr:flavin reductase family protein [Desulfovibrio inopinatus]